jgi:hypothetical protein
MKKYFLIGAMLITALIVVAFVSQQENLRNGDNIGKEYPEPVLEIVEQITERYGLNVNQVTILSAEQVEWPNACLGLAGEDEMCAEVITPGWKIVLESGDKEYTFHTDLSGENMRQK